MTENQTLLFEKHTFRLLYFVVIGMLTFSVRKKCLFVPSAQTNYVNWTTSIQRNASHHPEMPEVSSWRDQVGGNSCQNCSFV